MFLVVSVVCIIGYLLGSIPNGYLVGKARGIDIRQHGSGNIGATNVLRTLGKKWGVLVFAGDALKGIAAVCLAALLAPRLEVAFLGASGSGALSPSNAAILGAICCILGHSFPVWLRFKGGKGVATMAGVMLALSPWAAVIAACVWNGFFYTTRYVSLASLAAAVALPTSVFFLPGGSFRQPLFWFNVVVGLLVTWRHRGNIQRLIQGTEHRFEKRKES